MGYSKDFGKKKTLPKKSYKPSKVVKPGTTVRTYHGKPLSAADKGALGMTFPKPITMVPKPIVKVSKVASKIAKTLLTPRRRKAKK